MRKEMPLFGAFQSPISQRREWMGVPFRGNSTRFLALIRWILCRGEFESGIDQSRDRFLVPYTEFHAVGAVFLRSHFGQQQTAIHPAA